MSEYQKGLAKSKGMMMSAAAMDSEDEESQEQHSSLSIDMQEQNAVSLKSQESGIAKTSTAATPTTLRAKSPTTSTSLPVKMLNRPLGSNEAFAYHCHKQENLTIVCGLTLLTKCPIDEGKSIKCYDL